MDSILDVKEALAARSRTTSLDDLKSQGRRLVKVIRAEHIAQMLRESVQKAVEGSEVVSRDEVDSLVARSQEEFKHLFQERQQEAADMRRLHTELDELREQCGQLTAELETSRSERETRSEAAPADDGSAARVAELEAQLAGARRQGEGLREELAEAKSAAESIAAGGASAAELERQLAQLRQDVSTRTTERDALQEELEARVADEQQLEQRLEQARAMATAGEEAAAARASAEKSAADLLTRLNSVEQERDAALRQLAELRREHEALRGQAGPSGDTQSLRDERDQLRRELDTRAAELERGTAKSQRLQQQVAELERDLAKFTAQLRSEQAQRDERTAKPAADVNPDLVMKLMSEVADLKANVLAKQMQGGGDAAPQASADLDAVVSKLAGSINDRLEHFGRKIGISGAVEAGDVKLDGLFSHEDETKLESNMDDVQVKKKVGGGIAANLERLKKLKEGS